MLGTFIGMFFGVVGALAVFFDIQDKIQIPRSTLLILSVILAFILTIVCTPKKSRNDSDGNQAADEESGAHYFSWKPVIIGAIVLTLGLALSQYKRIEKPDDSSPPSSVSSESTGAMISCKIGDTILFGTYTQDNSSDSIQWQILDIQAGKALAVSTEALVIQPYNFKYGDISWEACSLRNDWLNGSFLQNSFTEEERSAIVGEVSLLSLDEVEQYFPNQKDRICFAISGAESNHDNGVRYEQKDGKTVMRVCWWLRGTGGDSLDAPYINFDGDNFTNKVANDYLFVRPAMWIDLEKYEQIK